MKTLTFEGLIVTDDDISIPNFINKLQAIIDEGFTHVHVESKTMYYDSDEYSLVHEFVEDIVL